MMSRLKTIVLLLFVLVMETRADGLGYTKDHPLIIGIDMDYAPMEYVDGNGIPHGLDVEFTQRLMKRLNIPFTYAPNTWVNIADDLKTADVLITGEGRLDFQTAQGKAPSGVAKLAKKINPNIITIGLGGSVADISDDAGLDAAFCILRSPMTLADAMQKEIAAENISETAAQIVKLVEKTSCAKV